MADLVSIIVPVYNAENYIAKNVKKLLEQTYSELEIIIIDDGSQDSTLEICMSLSKLDKRIKVMYHSNHGVSYTRNVGIKHANGKYCMFMDADDFIESTAVEDMHSCFKENSVDVVLCGYLSVGAKTTIEYSANTETKVYDKNTFFHNIEKFMGPHILDNIGTKMYKKSIIRANELLFNESMDIYEDISFCINYLRKCDSIAYIDKPYYTYNIGFNHGSLSSGFNKKSIENVLKYIFYFKEYCQMWGNQGKKKFLDESAKRIINVIYMAAMINYSMLDSLIDYYGNQPIVEELFGNRKKIPLKKSFILLLTKYKFKRLLFFFMRVKSHIDQFIR